MIDGAGGAGSRWVNDDIDALPYADVLPDNWRTGVDQLVQARGVLRTTAPIGPFPHPPAASAAAAAAATSRVNLHNRAPTVTRHVRPPSTGSAGSLSAFATCVPMDLARIDE